jgi:hypothetical protein
MQGNIKSSIQLTIHTVLILAGRRQKELDTLTGVPQPFRRMEQARIKADVLNSLLDIGLEKESRRPERAGDTMCRPGKPLNYWLICWRGRVNDLLRSQTSHRVGDRCPERLDPDGKQGDGNREETGQGQHPPGDGYPVYERLQPFVHCPPGDRSRDDDRDKHQF